MPRTPPTAVTGTPPSPTTARRSRRIPKTSSCASALERASRRASADHLERGRQLEAQDQMAGAIAEYKQAADLDRGNTMAVTKAFELERRMREQIEAARPPSAAAAAAAAGGAAVGRAAARSARPRAAGQLSEHRHSRHPDEHRAADRHQHHLRPRRADRRNAYTIQVQDIPVEDVLNQVMSANSSRSRSSIRRRSSSTRTRRTNGSSSTTSTRRRSTCRTPTPTKCCRSSTR